jgi:isoleucyl-tRNA synthetase
MSKSLGNTIEPDEIIAKSGAESLRLWTAMVDYREEMRLGPEILARVVEAYRKIRNTCRILVANLYDFDPVRDLLPREQLEAVDRYALARYADTMTRVLRAYDEYDFQVIVHALTALTTVDLSAFYVDVTKDRLYTLAADSTSRRAAQTTMYVIVDGLARILAPVLPVTADQLWKVLPGTREASVHVARFPELADLEALQDPTLVAEWDRLLAIRAAVNVELERQRKEKVIGNSLGAAVTLRAGGADLALLERYGEDLPALLIVSGVTLVPVEGGGVQVEAARAEGVKCQRCWRVVPSVSGEPGREGLCDRCVEALAEAVQP